MPLILPFSLMLTEAAPLPAIHADTFRPKQAMATVARTSPPVIVPQFPDRGRRATIAVEALGGGQTLWSGTLRVAMSSGASVSRSMNQAPPYDCPGDERGRYRTQQNSFNLNLNMQNYGDQGTSYGFSVNWQRPDDDCAEAMVQRSVQLSGTTALEPGKTVTLTGDAGLVLKLRLASEEGATARP